MEPPTHPPKQLPTWHAAAGPHSPAAGRAVDRLHVLSSRADHEPAAASAGKSSSCQRRVAAAHPPPPGASGARRRTSRLLPAMHMNTHALPTNIASTPARCFSLFVASACLLPLRRMHRAQCAHKPACFCDGSSQRMACESLSPRPACPQNERCCTCPSSCCPPCTALPSSHTLTCLAGWLARPYIMPWRCWQYCGPL